MIEQGDYMVVNLASRVRDLSRIQQSAKLQPRFGLWVQFQPKHIAWYELPRFLDLKRSFEYSDSVSEREGLRSPQPIISSSSFPLHFGYYLRG
jgi:hypothetical protein